MNPALDPIVNPTLDPTPATESPTRRTGRRRRWMISALVLLLLAAAITPLIWWKVAAHSYALASGDVIAQGLTATTLYAGDDTEYCYPSDKPFTFGFSVWNRGNHTVTLTKIDPIKWIDNQSVTVDITEYGNGDPLPTASSLPVTFRPGQDRLVILRMTPKPGLAIDAGAHSVTNTAILHFTVLGTSRTQTFLIDGGTTYVGLSSPDSHGKSCDLNQPPIAS